MSGKISFEELRDLYKNGELHTVICATPDHWGRLVGKRLPVDTFLDVALSAEGLHGSLFLLCVDMEMEPRSGYALTDWARGFHDFRFVPDLGTLRVIPWQPGSAIVLCDVCEENSDRLISVAPRSILKLQIEKAKEHNMSVKCATELEFYMYHNSLNEAWALGYENLDPVSHHRSDYNIFQGTLNEKVISAIRNEVSAADIEIESSKPEWGLGQQEINLRYADALEMADRHIIYKNAVKEIAARHENSVTFMAKPYYEEVGSSCHIHLSLWDEEGTKALGWDEEQPHNMSKQMNYFLGGCVSLTRDFTIAYAPTINSYKRLQPESFAPTAIAVGEDNRTCSYRLVGHSSSYRFENRLPGADAHPYIAIAAMIASGVYGIDHSLPSPLPYSGNAYTDTNLERVALTMGEAIEEFRDSKNVSNALGDDVHAHLLNHYQTENNDFLCHTVTDWERKRYFERI